MTNVTGWLVLGAMILVTVTGCNRDGAASAEENAPPPMVVGPENVVIVRDTVLSSGPVVSGTLRPVREAQVRAEVGGPVTEVVAREGERVARGAVLARIDATTLRDAFLSARAAVRSAETALRDAERNLERDRRLVEAGAISEREVERSESAFASAEAALADARARLVSAREQLADATVRASFAGVVSERAVSAGDVVQSGTLLYAVVDPSSMRLEATVPADYLQRLKTGTTVDFSVAGYGRRTFTGRIDRINPAVDPATRQVRIYVEIPNPEEGLVAGLFAEGRVETERDTAPAVPMTAVDQRGTSPTVLRLEQARVERMPVTLGLQDARAEMVAVTRGVVAGDTLLLGSAQGISEGTVVRVRQEAGVAELADENER